MSPYKFLGPHCGVVTGRAELLERLHPDKLRPATDAVPERFDFGTLPYELMAGVTAAVDTLAGMVAGEGPRRERLRRSMAAAHVHEDALRSPDRGGPRPAAGRDRSLPSRTPPRPCWSRSPTTQRPTSPPSSPQRASTPQPGTLRQEMSQHLGLGLTGGLRIGLAPYTDDEDVDRLLAALESALG